MAPGLGEAILNLIDTIAPPIISILPTPLNFIFSGVAGFVKGLLEVLLG